MNTKSTGLNPGSTFCSFALSVVLGVNVGRFA